MDIYEFLKSPEKTSQDIVSRVRARRKEKKITQEQLSIRANVSLGSIKRFERTGEISLTSLIKIGYALGCQNDFDHLFEKKAYASIQEVLDEQI
ncbi:MAG: helix-turn-helix transcriptional regulator [Eubacteriales bacterium]|nr:helix-turn-helix transcriptional regulator [Eubacteriales bacterium]